MAKGHTCPWVTQAAFSISGGMPGKEPDGMSDKTETTETTEQTTTETEDVAGLKSALSAERDARKTAEKSAKDFQKRLSDIESSGKSEADKLAARLESLEKDNQAKARSIAERDARDAVRDAAKKAGAPDGDLIWRVLKTDIEYADDGEAKNVKDLINDLKTTTPHLFKTTPARVDGGAGAGARTNATDMNARIRQAAGVAE